MLIENAQSKLNEDADAVMMNAEVRLLSAFQRQICAENFAKVDNPIDSTERQSYS